MTVKYKNLLIVAGVNSLPQQTGDVNRALAEGEVKPPGFLPWQKLEHSGKCSRQRTPDLGNQDRGNLSSDESFLTGLLHAGMFCGLYMSSFEVPDVLKM